MGNKKTKNNKDLSLINKYTGKTFALTSKVRMSTSFAMYYILFMCQVCSFLSENLRRVLNRKK